MDGLDVVFAGQVGDGPSNSEDAMVCARAQAQTFNRAAYQHRALGLQLAERARISDPHLGIAGDAVTIGEALPLALTRGRDACPNDPRRLTGFRTGQFFELDATDAEMHVDAIQDRSAEPLLIARDHRFSAHPG